MKIYKIFLYSSLMTLGLLGCGDDKTTKTKTFELREEGEKKYTNHSSCLAIGDMDDDKDLDIIVFDSFGRLHLVENHGKGKFEDKGQIGKNYSEISDISKIVIGDIDQDGKPDIIITDRSSKVAYMEYEGKGKKWNKMKIVFSIHGEDKIKRRSFLREEILDVIKYPDKILKKHEKYYFQKKIERGNIEIVCEMKKYIKIITFYWI